MSDALMELSASTAASNAGCAFFKSSSILLHRGDLLGFRGDALDDHCPTFVFSFSAMAVLAEISLRSTAASACALARSLFFR